MTPSSPVPAQPPRALRSAEHLVGWLVEDRHGNVLGTVRQLLFDLHTGRLAYAVVVSGGFVGEGEACFALAWEGLEPSDARRRFVWHGPAPRPCAAMQPRWH